MAVTDNGQVMIDYVLERHGGEVNSSAARLRVLKWIQAAEEMIWGMRDWWWNWRTQTLTFVDGTQTYTVSSVAAVKSAYDKDGKLLQYLPPAVFHRNFGGDTSTGTPEFWTAYWFSAADDYKVEVYPTPDSSAAGNGSVAVLGPHGTIGDSTGSDSEVPLDHRTLLLWYAEWQQSLWDGQVDVAQAFKEQWETGLAAMVAEDERQPKRGA